MWLNKGLPSLCDRWAKRPAWGLGSLGFVGSKSVGSRCKRSRVSAGAPVCRDQGGT